MLELGFFLTPDCIWCYKSLVSGQILVEMPSSGRSVDAYYHLLGVVPLWRLKGK